MTAIHTSVVAQSTIPPASFFVGVRVVFGIWLISWWSLGRI